MNSTPRALRLKILVPLVAVASITLATVSKTLALDGSDGRSLIRATIRIHHDGSYGSGVVVKRLYRNCQYLNYFLSAEHVTGDAGGTVTVYTFNNGGRTPSGRYIATILGANEAADVSFGYFWSGDERLPTFALAKSAYDTPFSTMNAGNSSGYPDWHFSQVKRKSSSSWVTSWECTAKGDSGGPLVDKAGEVVGLCKSSNGSHSFFVKLSDIHALLRRRNHAWLFEGTKRPAVARSTSDPSLQELVRVLEEAIEELEAFQKRFED